MGGLPWFELDTDAVDHPKTARLCLALDEDLALTYIVRIWSYCYRVHLSDRFDGPNPTKWVEDVVRWVGKRGRFVDAAVAAGYLERDGSALIAHGVAERLTPHLGKRDRDTERQRQRRDKLDLSLGRRGDVAATNGRCRQDVSGDRDRDRDRDRDKDRDKDPIDRSSRSEPEPDPAADSPDGAKPVLPPFERFRLELTRRLADANLVSRAVAMSGLGVPQGRKLGDTIRRVVAAIEHVGLDAAIEACVDAAGAASEPPETVVFFLRTLDRVEPPPPTRERGEFPMPGDPDFNDASAWPSYQAFLDRDAGRGPSPEITRMLGSPP